jgi:hypothetical protein
LVPNAVVQAKPRRPGGFWTGPGRAARKPRRRCGRSRRRVLDRTGAGGAETEHRDGAQTRGRDVHGTRGGWNCAWWPSARTSIWLRQQPREAWPGLGHTKSSGGPALRWPSEWPQRGHFHQRMVDGVALVAHGTATVPGRVSGTGGGTPPALAAETAAVHGRRTHFFHFLLAANSHFSRDSA